MIFTNNVCIDFHFVVLLSQCESFIITFGHNKKLDGRPIVTELQKKSKAESTLISLTHLKEVCRSQNKIFFKPEKPFQSKNILDKLQFCTICLYLVNTLLYVDHNKQPLNLNT